MATQYEEYEYEIFGQFGEFVKKVRTLDRIGNLFGEQGSAELDEILTKAFFTQFDSMIPIMKRFIALREEMKVEELKDSLSDEE